MSFYVSRFLDVGWSHLVRPVDSSDPTRPTPPRSPSDAVFSTRPGPSAAMTKGRGSLGGFGASLSAMSLGSGRTSSPGWGEDDVWDSSSDTEDTTRRGGVSAAPAPALTPRPSLGSSWSFAGTFGSSSSSSAAPRLPAQTSNSSSVVLEPTSNPTSSSSSSKTNTSAPATSSSSSWLPYRSGKSKAESTAEIPLEAQELSYVSLGTEDVSPGFPDSDKDSDGETEEPEEPPVREELEEILLGAFPFVEGGARYLA